MKKLLAIVLVLVMMLPLVGTAEEKYAGMSMSELQAEFTAILQAMWKTDEWQQVKVPAGVYQVGVEIPAGEWTLKSASDGLLGMVDITIGTKLNEARTEIDGWGNQIATQMFMQGQTESWTVTLKEGWFVVISMGSVYFTVPVKGEGFTFK